MRPRRIKLHQLSNLNIPDYSENIAAKRKQKKKTRKKVRSARASKPDQTAEQLAESDFLMSYDMFHENGQVDWSSSFLSIVYMCATHQVYQAHSFDSNHILLFSEIFPFWHLHFIWAFMLSSFSLLSSIISVKSSTKYILRQIQWNTVLLFPSIFVSFSR